MSDNQSKFWALLDRTRPGLPHIDRHVLSNPSGSTPAWQLLRIYEVRRDILAKSNKEHPQLGAFDDFILNLRSEMDAPVRLYRIACGEERYGIFVDMAYSRVIGVLRAYGSSDISDSHPQH